MCNKNLLIFLIIHFLKFTKCNLWESECPLVCTCQLQPLTETPIYRFAQKDKNRSVREELFEFNEVSDNENIDDIDLLEQTHRAIIVRSAICILQTETNPMELIESLPSNMESLTFIHGYDSGNKTIKFNWLNKFDKLISLELIGPDIFHKNVTNHLLCHIDFSLESLNYLNLERVLIQNSNEQMQSFLNVLKENDMNITFEYIQKIDEFSHPLTIIQNDDFDEDIVPYKIFKEQRKNSGELPLFFGFKNLLLLRISNCELNNIFWETFDGLSELQYLILEKNNLKFIPAFAFYGTPNLKSLSLACNKLLDIEITDLAGLLQLEYLDLTYNSFTQLSELSFPPFPRLKLANFANNPIEVIFPNTFEVMNTTDSLIIGSEDIALALLPNSFAGLDILKTLTVNNVNVNLLKRELFIGMPQLKQLVLTGNISSIEYDAFLEVSNLETLILSNCKITSISMDGFLGLINLQYLDLSNNELQQLPAGVFDDLESIKELYMNGNKFNQLPRDIFSKIHPKLLRLNDNPWHCSCKMSEWKPIIASRIRQKVSSKNCNYAQDKGIDCQSLENRFEYKYTYDARMAPKCLKPDEYKNWSVFHAMRKTLKCPDYKPKIKKYFPNKNSTIDVSGAVHDNYTKDKMIKSGKISIKNKLRKLKYLKYRLNKKNFKSKSKTIDDTEISEDDLKNNEANDINEFQDYNNVRNDVAYDTNSLANNNRFNFHIKQKQFRKHLKR